MSAPTMGGGPRALVGTGRAEPPLHVRGGIGGIAVEVAELDRAAGRLRALGAELAGCSRAGGAVLLQVQTAGGQVLDPAGFVVTEGAVLAALTGPGGLAPMGASLVFVAELLVTAASGYQAAEAAASGAIRGVELAVGQAGAGFAVLTLPALFPLLAIAAGARWSSAELERLTGLDLPGPSGPDIAGPAGRELLQLLEQHGPVTEHLLVVLAGAAGVIRPGPDSGPAMATRILLVAGLLGRATGGPPWLADPGRAVVSVPGTGLLVQPPDGVAALVRGIPPSSAVDPVVRVEQLDGPTGRHWVVSVPGTDSWPLTPRLSPFDASGAVGTAALHRTAGLQAVESAMTAAGIRPGEPVMLVGHSQGGMLAASVAADPVIRSRFTVTHVVTAGSPIAATPVPAHVQVLSIEHDDDLVPHLDGATNPDRENWTTVSTKAMPPGPYEPLAAHAQAEYAQTAARIDASRDASVRAWAATASGFLDGPGTTATSWTMHVRRG